MKLSPLSHNHSNVDENGEQIIIEGVCYRRGYWVAFIMAALTGLVGLVTLLIVPIALCLALAAIKAWRLYLTRDAIHYRRQTCCCHLKTAVIPLSCVKDVAVETGTNNVLLLMEVDDIHKYMIPMVDVPLFWYCCPHETYVKLWYVANCQSFVQAVKQEIANKETS